MSAATQVYRPLRIATGLGPDALLLTGLSGREELSQPFRFTLTLVAPEPADFAQVLGRPAAVALDLPEGGSRYFQGVISRFSQGKRDDEYIHYSAELVPAIWMLSKRVQSRTFQQLSVPEILNTVFAGFDFAPQLVGTFHPRDYCVQYRESDLAFASRLMEEEGIYYYFVHTEGGHTLVLANTPQGHADVGAPNTLIYDETEGGNRPDARVTAWEKVQELRAGKVTLWDHCFEMPGNRLDAETATLASVQVGAVVHKLGVGPVPELELYDYPGGYAGRFDGIDPGGGDRAADLKRIFDDSTRTASLRMQQEAAGAVQLHGASHGAQLTAGHKFALTRHYDADGDYVLTRIEHAGELPAPYRSGADPQLTYHNQFDCIPATLPFRPARTTARPIVAGTQTAVVVGPAGQEIFTDKYSRVKVQFHWDRQGQFNADSSCWVRVATVWAGGGWGVVHIPRIGQEVVVAFEEGDPDQPLIVGSVYNAEQMPAGKLPNKGMVSGFKSASTPGGGGFNQVTLDDTKGKEQITIHGQYDMVTKVLHDQKSNILNDRTDKIDVNDALTVGGNQTITVTGDVVETFDSTQKTTVTKTIDIASKTAFIHIESPTEIKLTVKGSTITITPDTITLAAANIHFEGKSKITGHAPLIESNATNKIALAAPTIESSAATEATHHGALISIVGDTKAVMGVADNTVTCDPASVKIAATTISSAAKAVQELTGATIKLN